MLVELVEFVPHPVPAFLDGVGGAVHGFFQVLVKSFAFKIFAGLVERVADGVFDRLDGVPGFLGKVFVSQRRLLSSRQEKKDDQSRKTQGGATFYMHRTSFPEGFRPDGSFLFLLPSAIVIPRSLTGRFGHFGGTGKTFLLPVGNS
ncbi:hypothetical protein BOX30_04220 [Leptospirillum ferriphilum]|nr:hypothetical protein BOX30_04220 [Leptospirillum ferriphilum]